MTFIGAHIWPMLLKASAQARVQSECRKRAHKSMRIIDAHLYRRASTHERCIVSFIDAAGAHRQLAPTRSSRYLFGRTSAAAAAAATRATTTQAHIGLACDARARARVQPLNQTESKRRATRKQLVSLVRGNAWRHVASSEQLN